MNGWQAFKIALNLVGCFIGVIALLHLASIGFNVEFKPLFKQFVEECRNWIETLILLPVVEAGVHWCLDQLRRVGWQIPDLADHWRSIFTLMWLLLGAHARHWTDVVLVGVSRTSKTPGNAASQTPGNVAGLIVWAFIVALIVAVAAGTQPLDSAAVVVWPLAGFFLFVAGLGVLDALAGDVDWWGVLGTLAFAALMITDYSAYPTIHGFAVGSPALLAVVAIVGGFGLCFAVLGLVKGKTWRERLSNGDTVMGLKILGTMGTALALAYFFQV